MKVGAKALESMGNPML